MRSSSITTRRSSTMTTFLYGRPVTVTLATNQGPVAYEVEDAFGRNEAHAIAIGYHKEDQDRNDWPVLSGDYALSRDGVVLYNSEDPA